MDFTRKQKIETLKMFDFRLSKAVKILDIYHGEIFCNPDRINICRYDVHSPDVKQCEFQAEYCYYTKENIIAIPLCKKHYNDFKLWHWKEYNKIYPET